MRTLPGCCIVSWMSLCAVVRLGRPGSGVDDVSIGCARDPLVPVSPVAGSNAGDMDADVLGLGCSFALLQRWRTLKGRRRLAKRGCWADDCAKGEWGTGVAADSDSRSICPLCNGLYALGKT